jgi:hypothetical protein
MPPAKRARQTPTGVANDTLLDSKTVDRADERTVQLHRILIQAYDDEYEALAIAGQVGLLKADIERYPKLSLTWWSILEESAREGRLRRLIEEALKDPTIANWKPQLSDIVVLSTVAQKPAKPVGKPKTDEEQRAASRRPKVGDSAKLWDVESELTIGFFKGSAKIKRWIEEAVMQWVEYANLKFVFTDVSKATIRVGFDQEGSWAYLGKQALDVPAAEPTCNFGWFNDTTQRSEVFGTVLHEFGHVLGLQHEHGNPASTLKWNKAAVYEALTGPPNFWDRATVDQEVFSIWPPKYFPVQKVFDRESIMMFQMPTEYFLQGDKMPENKVLSDLDKQFVAALYPLLTQAR